MLMKNKRNIEGLSAQDGPHVGPMNLAIRNFVKTIQGNLALGTQLSFVVVNVLTVHGPMV